MLYVLYILGTYLGRPPKKNSYTPTTLLNANLNYLNSI